MVGANAKDTINLVCHYGRFFSLEIQNLSCIMFIHTESQGKFFRNIEYIVRGQQFVLFGSQDPAWEP